MSFAGKKYWLVGASEGLGRALAKELDRKGARLVLSARSKGRLDAVSAELSQPAQVLPLDVSDAVSIQNAVVEMGNIDGVIYIAALYEPMTAQNWDAETAEAIADVSYMGGLRVLGRVMPVFVGKDSGHIVVIGSLSGYRGLRGALAYGASKSGLMHLTEAMRADLWRTGIKVQLFNLGFIKTRLTEKNRFKMPFLMTPEQAARKIARGMGRARFKQDTPWFFSLIFRSSRLLPQFLYQRLFAR